MNKNSSNHLLEIRSQGLKHTVGNTPLLAIHFKYKKCERVIYAKAEHLNLTGSIKDRMALHILLKAYDRGVLHPGDTIIEATSGNTGIAFSAIGKALGHSVRIFMPDWMSQERKDLIKSLGATITLVSKEEGGFLGSIRMSEELAQKEKNIFLPRQFANEDNTEAHYYSTGPEIWWQMAIHNLKIDAFVAGVGTGGTVMGVGKFLQSKNPAIKIHPLEPANSPTMSTGYKIGKHRIQGISDEFIPEIVKLPHLNEIIAVDDGDAIIMAQKLSREVGLSVGISSGANFLGALKAQELLGKDACVVTVFSDDNKKYLSTDLVKEEKVQEGFLSSEISLLGFSAIKRACHLCCNPDECQEKKCSL
ncbi:MAG: cysteine synthase family protein [Oligoflexia bacterium]|nr:cysteine synthase family protein [Oligoflexia bacterium]MBF0364941.1 cysteine synthase family protein [Oligoflexia bacterium]